MCQFYSSQKLLTYANRSSGAAWIHKQIMCIIFVTEMTFEVLSVSLSHRNSVTLACCAIFVACINPPWSMCSINLYEWCVLVFIAAEIWLAAKKLLCRSAAKVTANLSNDCDAFDFMSENRLFGNSVNRCFDLYVYGTVCLVVKTLRNQLDSIAKWLIQVGRDLWFHCNILAVIYFVFDMRAHYAQFP